MLPAALCLALLAGLLHPSNAQAAAIGICEASYATGGGGSVQNTGPVAGGCSAAESLASIATANSQAIAAPGLLRAYATASTTPAAGTASFLGATATAQFTDSFTVSGLSSGQAAALTFNVRVTGHLGSSTTLAPQLFFGDSQNTTGSADFNFTASLSKPGVPSDVSLSDCVHAEKQPGIAVCSGQLRPALLSVDQTLPMAITVQNGDVVTLDMVLRANALAVAQRDGSAAAGESNMFDTVRWLGLASALVDGQPYDGPLTLTSESGFNYLTGAAPEAIAEPASLALTLTGLGALAVSRRRARAGSQAR